MNDERTTLLTWHEYLTRLAELEDKSSVTAMIEHANIDTEERRTWDDWQTVTADPDEHPDAGEEPYVGRHRA